MNRKIMKSIKKAASNVSTTEYTNSNKKQVEEELKPLTVSREKIEFHKDDVLSLLNEISAQYDKDMVNSSISNIKKSVLNSITTTFGTNKKENELNNKDGGNVTTHHNANKSIYANTDQDFKRQEYAGYSYQKSRKEHISENLDNETLKDVYTGNNLATSDVDIDHINSVNDIHKNFGFMVDKETRKKIGSEKGNFAATHKSINRSKSDRDLTEFSIDKGLDKRRTNAAKARADLAINKYSPSTPSTLNYYASNTIETGMSQGVNSAFSNGVGAFLSELAYNIFNELGDLLSQIGSLDITEFLKESINKVKNIVVKTASKWKDIFKEAKDGFLSGFLSNLVTVIINSLYSTGKNIIRIIKEGFLKIFQAIKLIVLPPEHLSKAEAFDLAIKILAGGIITVIGIAVEEAVKNLLLTLPFIGFIAAELSAIICSLLVGISISIVLYFLDKIDIFGIKAAKKHSYIMDKLYKVQQDADEYKLELINDINKKEHEFNTLDNEIMDIERNLNFKV